MKWFAEFFAKHCVKKSFHGVFEAASNSRNFRAIRFFEKAKGNATQHLPAEEKGRKRGRRKERRSKKRLNELRCIEGDG